MGVSACPFLPGPHLPVPHPLIPNSILKHRRTFAALAMSDELRLDHKLRPGDIALVNNLTLLHAKTAFKVRLSDIPQWMRPHPPLSHYFNSH